MLFEPIADRCLWLSKNFHEIGEDRKIILQKLADYISLRIQQNKPIQLHYICTHNSRRSHLGQVWAAVAAVYFNIPQVFTYSGGTEATAFNPNAIEALRAAGFTVKKMSEDTNPLYHVHYTSENYCVCYSKKFDDQVNPANEFAAVMTCSDADENCPYIRGCDIRIGSTYNDPKAYDNSPLQSEKYTERSNQIALECLYVFSKIKS